MTQPLPVHWKDDVFSLCWARNHDVDTEDDDAANKVGDDGHGDHHDENNHPSKPFRSRAEEANLLNEEARIRVDSLNTEAHNLQLRETLRQTEEELNARDKLIDKYQLEIRQRNDEIEKKVIRLRAYIVLPSWRGPSCTTVICSSRGPICHPLVWVYPQPRCQKAIETHFFQHVTVGTDP